MPRENTGASASYPIALIGHMGVGKTTIGRRLAKRLGREFYDSDEEIERASGRTIAGYFKDHGEAAFREGETRVINRLLEKDNVIVATGGGAFINETTRAILLDKALTVWLRADFETIMERVMRNDERPLLQVEDPRAKMKSLMHARDPIYTLSPVHVKVARGPHIRTVNRVLKAVKSYKKSEMP